MTHTPGSDEAALAAAVAAAGAADLLPDRTQARAAELAGPFELVDALFAGDDAYLALVRAGERLLVVPGLLDGSGFHRAPVGARILRTHSSGAFRVERLGALDAQAGLLDALASSPERPIAVDQSNDSVILGDQVMLKWQIDAAPSPAPARMRSLAGSSLTPEPLAIIEWIDPNSGEALTLATASRFMPGARDGWEWAVELVRAHAQGTGVDAIGPFACIGQMAGEMHVAFAGAGITELSADDVAGFSAAAGADLATACDLIDGVEGERLRQRRGRIAARLEALDAVGSTPAIDIHGDFHVGQIIEAGQGEFLIVDFDGSPAQPPAERLEKQPAARDVAGMLASIDHVARVVNYRTEGLDPRPALIWIAHAQEAFLAEYQAVLAQHGLRRILDDRLISPFLLQQEMREYIYAARHLPHWRYVPDAVITSEFPDASPSRSDT